jgi:hypothetical protein
MKMTVKRSFGFGAAAAVVALSAAAGTVMAAPVTALNAELKASASVSSLADKTASRRCWRQNGKENCAKHIRQRAYRGEPDGYYEHHADKLPFGSQVWWDQMVREGRGGNGQGSGRN